MSAEYEQAMSSIRRGLVFTNGGPQAESRAADSYQAMVREGTASQIKRKYRVGRYLKKVR